MAEKWADRADLHTHTTASDGTLSPRQLVALAGELGLGAVAITDHDTVAGLAEGLAAGEELGGRQGDKLKDLGLIYAAYQALEAQGRADPRGRLDRLARQLEDTRWGEGMAFYVYGFTDFTPQEERVLSALMAQGELTAALVCDTGDDPSGVFRPALRCAKRLARLAKANAVPVREETLARPLPRHPSLAFLERHLFGPLPETPWAGACAAVRIAAGDPRQEVEWCAAEILRLLREEGYRCREIAVCARRADGYGELIDSVFSRYGVPVFRSAMEDILEKPVLALVTSALAAAGSDYPYEELFRYLKTGLTGITEEERDLLENYALTWDLKGSAWTRRKPWDMHPEGYGREFSEEDRAFVAWLDELRRRVIAPLEALRKNPDKTGRGRALALYQFLEDIDLPTRLAQRADSLDRRGDRPGLLEFYDRRAVEVDQLAYRGMKKLRRRRRVDRKSFAEARKLLWQAFERFRKVCEDEGLETPEDYDRRYKMHYLCAEWLEELLSLLDEGEQYEAVKAVLSAQKE